MVVTNIDLDGLSFFILEKCFAYYTVPLIAIITLKIKTHDIVSIPIG